MDGKKVYELLPDIDWDKGKAVLWLLENLGLDCANGRPIYVGDDRTDEDAFRALGQRGVGILVSEQPRPTAASYSLKDPAEVGRFLRELVATLT
jgi:trehalose-phosphatase